MGTSQNHEPLTRWFNDVQCLNSEGSLWKIVASSGFKAHPSCRNACSRRHAQAGCGAAYALSMLIGFTGSVWDIVVILYHVIAIELQSLVASLISLAFPKVAEKLD